MYLIIGKGVEGGLAKDHTFYDIFCTLPLFDLIILYIFSQQSASMKKFHFHAFSGRWFFVSGYHKYITLSKIFLHNTLWFYGFLGVKRPIHLEEHQQSVTCLFEYIFFCICISFVYLYFRLCFLETLVTMQRSVANIPICPVARGARVGNV